MRNYRPPSAFLLASAAMLGGHLLATAAPADPPPLRGLTEVGHAQVELLGGSGGRA